MNCNLNDWAIVVNTPLRARAALGCVVKCTELFDGPTGLATWVVEPPAKGYRGIGDRWLRPIRDIGPDEIDEVIQHIGSPNGVTA